jgi:cholesterol transport system auxiliary component
MGQQGPVQAPARLSLEAAARTAGQGGESSASPQASSSLTVQVSAPWVAPAFAGERIAYRREPLRLEYYTLSRWAEPPQEAVAAVLTRRLEESGVFRVVLPPQARLSADRRLAIDVDLMEERVPPVGPAPYGEAEVALRARWVQTSDGRVLASKRFAATVSVPRPDAEGAAMAIGEALARVSADVARWAVATESER